MPFDGLSVSAPVPGSVLAALGGPSDTLVFVAAPPGSLRRAAAATVVGTDGDSVAVRLLDGGFDPVGVSGRLGGRIGLVVRDSGGRTITTAHDVRARPPRVVRTVPTARRSDVPLNTRIDVVFSLPMEAAAASGVRLLGPDGPVTGTARLDADGLQVQFEPSSPLVPLAFYEIEVDAGIRDRLGRVLGTGVRVTFRAGGPTVPPTTTVPQALQITSCTYPYRQGVYLERTFHRLVVGDTGVACSLALLPASNGRGEPTAWSSSDSTVIALSERDGGIIVVRGLRPGTAFLRAEVRGVPATTLVEVFGDRVPAASTEIYVHRPFDGATGARRDELWRQRLDGSGAVRLFSPSEIPSDDVVPCVAEDCYDPPFSYDVAPDGRIAIARLEGHGGVWVKDPARGTLARITSTVERGAAHTPLWSPDGSMLAYWFDTFTEGMTELRVVNPDGSGQRTLARAPFDTDPFADDDTWWGWLWSTRSIGGSRTRWHADGRRLLRAVPQGTEQLPVDGGAPSPYLAGHSPGPWLPGGTTQLVTEFESLWQVRWVEQASQYPKAMKSRRADAGGLVDGSSGTDVAWPVIAVSPDGSLVADLVSVYTPDRSAYVPMPSYWRIVGFAR